MVGVYYIINKVENKKYIGCSRDVEKRFNEHKKMLQEGIHHSYKLQDVFNKYGFNSFEFKFVEACDCKDLYVVEARHIIENDSIKNGYNVAEPNVIIGLDGSMKSIDILYNKNLVCKPNFLIWNDKTKYSRLQYDFLNLILQFLYRNPKDKEFTISIEDLKAVSKQSINKKYFLELGRELEKLSEFEELKPIIDCVKVDRCRRNFKVMASSLFDISLFKKEYTIIDLSICKDLKTSELFMYEIFMSYNNLINRIKKVKLEYTNNKIREVLGVDLEAYSSPSVMMTKVLKPIKRRLKDFGMIVNIEYVGRGSYNEGFMFTFTKELED